MKTSYILGIVAAVVLLLIVFYSFTGKESQVDYVQRILNERKDKNEQFKSASDSPFHDDAAFDSLRYFPVDPSFKILCKLIPIEKKEVSQLGTSDGAIKSYLTYGYAEFDLDGVHNKLLILEIIDEGPFRGTLFLAFGDETSAKETYGAGRYLDVKKVPAATTVTLDFNKAYNPYCAYKNEYSCPLPPAENLLKVAIRAGEKTYH